VSPEEISLYGCVEPDGDAVNADGAVKIRRIVEKPPRAEAPSNLAVIGRYVFTPQIFDALDRITPGAGGELQLTDAIGVLLREETVVGRRFTQGRYDAGMKVDFLRANLELALDRPDLAADVEAMIVEVVRRRGLA
jgi:UTP--glucose-1-phosphate uridylyltransferase